MTASDAYDDAQRRNGKRARLDTWLTFNPALAPGVWGSLLGMATEEQIDACLDLCWELQKVLDQGYDVEIRVEPPGPVDGSKSVLKDPDEDV